jgi:hypothetical protein
MKSKEIRNKIIDIIENNNFEIDYTTMSDTAYYIKGFGSLSIEFLVEYETEIKDYIFFDDAPEEGDVVFHPRFVNELAIYINKDVAEIKTKHYEQIKNALYWKIIHE